MYGYRRIYFELLKRNIYIGINKVSLLMNEINVHSVCHKKYKYMYGEAGNIADNIINRDFKALGPYKKLSTDITEFKINNTKIYLQTVIDMWNREVLSYNISKHPDMFQARKTIEDLINNLPNGHNPILHSDQGWQFQHKQTVRLLKENNITQSMSRKGNCYDNAIIETFFGRLKKEFYYKRKFTSVEDFINKLMGYIKFFNEERIHSALEYMSPKQYKEKYTCQF